MDLGTAVNLACLWEATAAKPGNVNRSSDFQDTTLIDFLASAAAIGPIFSRAGKLSVNGLSTGEIVLESIRATRKVTSRNTNLGIVLLLAPLAVSFSQSRQHILEPDSFEKRVHHWEEEVCALLNQLDSAQADLICQAIDEASPGGLGEKNEGDVRQGSGGKSVVELMGLAKDQDLIAKQYAEGFSQVFHDLAGTLRGYLVRNYPLQEAIIGTYLRTLSLFPDSLIARKNGNELAEKISLMAGRLYEAWPGGESALYQEFSANQDWYWGEVADFDFFLRSDGNRRNPGTTADLIAAGLFVLLCLNEVQPNCRW